MHSQVRRGVIKQPNLLRGSDASDKLTGHRHRHLVVFKNPADGVAPDDLYPLDVERALLKLSTIKDNIIFCGSADLEFGFIDPFYLRFKMFI